MKTRSLFDIFDKPEPVIPKTPNVNLRPYQMKAVDSVFEQWERVQSTLVVCPTGTGKSVIFSEVMRRYVEANT